MNFAKNKTSIIAVLALIIVCGGSFLGVRMMRNSVETETTTVPPNYIVITTESTTGTTQAPTVPSTIPPTQAPSVQTVITTFPVSTTVPTTTAPTTESTTVTTTVPTTVVTLPTTTAPTTVAPTTTAPTLPGTTTSSNGGSIFGEGLAGYLYSADGNFYFTSADPWQRVVGYGEIYDTLAPFAIFYLDTMRCKFNYDNKDWCIQFWKGQYGMIFVGMEIGVYTKDPSREIEYYDAASDEDALYMTSTCYRNGEEIFTREYAKYWWCTGFVPGRLEQMSDRSELVTKSRITMKDYNMLLRFCSALKENGLVLGEDFSTKGLDVYVTW